MSPDMARKIVEEAGFKIEKWNIGGKSEGNLYLERDTLMILR